MFKQILVALKFGPASIFALKKSIELTRENDANLHIFHALDYSLKDLGANDPRLVGIMNETELRYKTEIAPLLGDLGKVTFKCLPADPALEVCRQARRIDADLIVMGCHHIVEKISLGRIDYVGITILEKAPCPVMLVPLNG